MSGFTGSDEEIPDLLHDLWLYTDSGGMAAADSPDVVADLKAWRDAAVRTAQDARWSMLRDYLTQSAAECEGAAAMADTESVPAVRFRSEAHGYRKALEKMAELETSR